jgi:hypothetical protein
LEEKQLENPAHYAVPSAGVNWGSLSNEMQFDQLIGLLQEKYGYIQPSSRPEKNTKRGQNDQL